MALPARVVARWRDFVGPPERPRLFPAPGRVRSRNDAGLIETEAPTFDRRAAQRNR
jgi:hypothetical protein